MERKKKFLDEIVFTIRDNCDRSCDRLFILRSIVMENMTCPKCGSNDLALGNSPLVNQSAGRLCRKCYYAAYTLEYYRANPDKRSDKTVKSRMSRYVEKNRSLVNLREKLRYTKRRLNEVNDPEKIDILLAKKAAITEQLELLVGS